MSVDGDIIMSFYRVENLLEKAFRSGRSIWTLWTSGYRCKPENGSTTR